MYEYRMMPSSTGYENRFGGFLVPFLLGGLGGSALVGLSRPRPVYITPGPYPYPNYYPNYYPYPY